jgi:adenylate cyclase
MAGARVSGIDRRLTTVLCADVAGYSGLMERDEDGTLLRLRDYRGRLTRMVEHHRGRIANTSGDGVLAEFPSATEALRAAVDVQRELGALNGMLPAEQRMHFRIGINVGDVMVERGDLFGEGVNVAARLQALAEPGAILISGPVHDLVRSKLAIAYDFLGARRVKNIASEIPVYRVRLGDERPREAAGLATPMSKPAEAGAPSVPHAGARERAIGSGLGALVLGGLALATGQRWMGIVAVVVLWLGLSHASAALAWPRRQRAALLCVLLVGFLAGINLLTRSTELWFLYPAAPLLALAALIGVGRVPRRPR